MILEDEDAWLLSVDIFLVVVTMTAVYLCIPKPLPVVKGKPANAMELTHTLWWYPFVFILVYYAFVSTYTLIASPQKRWMETTYESEAFFRLYVAAQIVAIPVEMMQPTTTAKKLQMIGHHVVSVGGYICGLTDGRCHFFGTAAGLSEMSTIFLEGLLLSKHVALEKFFSKRAPWFATLNGAGLWLSFIIFRIILFPTLLAIFAYDAYEHDAWRVAGDSITKFVVVPAHSFLFLLSLSWFSKIHQGFVDKVMGKKKVKV